MKTRILSALTVAGIVAASFLYVACDDSNGVTEPPGGTSSGQTSSGTGPGSLDGGTDGGGKDCFDPPFTTHFQIINACTNADKIDRKPTSTKIFPDGGLPKP